jgi:hypothetical protein
MDRYTSIDGLVGRDPVGAVVTVGQKGANGAPTDRDRFFFKNVFAQDVGGTLRKEPHPAFASYNSAAPEKRRTLRGNLVHARIEDCFEAGLAAQKLTGFPSHPKKIPTCCGNGKVATRFYGKLADGTDDFRQIVCPNNLCPARIGKKKECSPAMRFLFRVNWSEGIALPKILVRLVSHSWNSAANFQGFFDYLAEQAAAFGLSGFSVFGIPFSITLTEKTNPEEKSRFPVLTITPECDLQDYFVWQRKQLESFGGKLALPAGLSAPENSSPEIIADDFADIVPGLPVSKPSNGMPDSVGVIDLLPPSNTLSPEAISRILSIAAEKGIDAERVERIVGGKLSEAPPSAELEILRQIAVAK